MHCCSTDLECLRHSGFSLVKIEFYAEFSESVFILLEQEDLAWVPDLFEFASDEFYDLVLRDHISKNW